MGPTSGSTIDNRRRLYNNQEEQQEQEKQEEQEEQEEPRSARTPTVHQDPPRPAPSTVGLALSVAQAFPLKCPVLPTETPAQRNSAPALVPLKAAGP